MDGTQVEYQISLVDLFTLTIFIDIFQLVHRTKGKKLVATFGANSKWPVILKVKSVMRVSDMKI